MTSKRVLPKKTDQAIAYFGLFNLFSDGANDVYSAQALEQRLNRAYALGSGGDNELFRIDSATLALTFKLALDFEALSNAGQNYIISNATPRITSPTKANFAENGSGTVYTITGGGPDAGTSLTYSLGGTDAGLININATSGAVTFKVMPDFEAPGDAGKNNVYDITVTASDGTLSSPAKAVAISVTNVNEAPSVTSAATAKFVENGSGAAYTVTGSGPDAATSLTYALGGTDSGLFNINATSGVVTFKAAPDFEAPVDSGKNNVYDIIVAASDGRRPSTAKVVAITVTNINEAPSVTSAATASFTENATGTVYTVTGSDPDTGAALTYALGGKDAGLFNINATSGVITFNASPDFDVPGDAGKNNVYDITVTASDGSLSSTAKAVAITVTNVNEAPSITSAATASFAENDTGTVYTAIGSDPDTGATLTYALGGTDAGLFAINAASGVVTFNATPDFEVPGDFGADNVYDITVTASDGSLSSTAQAVAITVTDVSETSAYTLTSKKDNFTGGVGINSFSAGPGTWSSSDILDGGGGTDTLTVNETSAFTAPTANVANIEIVDITGTDAITADATAWSGLTTLTITGVGAVAATAGAAAISVTETGVGQGANNIAIDGGKNISIASMAQSTGTITIGATTQPTGTVTVTTDIVAGVSGGAITINGGTSVQVTQNVTHAVGTTVLSESAVTVIGGASTTDVSITQGAVATAANAVTAVTGISAINAVNAAPGTQPVTARTAVSAVKAVTAVAGVTASGVVTIIDAGFNTLNANTISSVTLANYGAGSAILGNALTSLSLSGTAGTLDIYNSGMAGPSANITLALALNALSGVSNTIKNTNNEITTLNVTTSGGDSTLAAFKDSSLTTLNVYGTKIFTLNSINPSLTSITVSGAAGFNDGNTTAANGFAALGGAATLTTTSSGEISIALNSTTQSFTGSTGKTTVQISSRVDATQAISGGSGTNDELIFEGGAYALTAITGAHVTGFETLGIRANVTGTIDMSNLASGFTGFHIYGNSSVAFTKVSNNVSLQLDKASTQVTMVLADATGPADTINVSLGLATSDSVNFGTLIFKDAASVGVGTVNLISNGVDITPGDAVANFNTCVITDNGLSNLNVSGTQGLKITTINQATSQATSFTLNNTNTGSAGVNIGVLTDTKLTSLNFTGTGASLITTLTASTTTSLAIDNSGTQLATVKAMTSTANLKTLNLSGNVQIGDGLVNGTGMTLTYTQGLTIDGSTDHAHVKFTLAGAGNGYVDNITLGNGNNTVTNVSTAGTVNLTVGTGSNYITLGGATTNSTGRYNITLGSHTSSGPDYITVGTAGTAYASTPNYVITGAVTGDRISFNADSVSSANSLTATTAGASVAQTVTAVEAAAAFSHGVAYAFYGGNTYIAQSVSGTLAGNDTTLIQLMGLHDLTASLGYVTLAS